jgi:hypothetical protein
MHIKHNEMDYSYPISLREWRKDYIEKGTFDNYTITNYSRVKELWKVDESTGELKFNMLIDAGEGNRIYQKNPKQFVLKDLNFKFYDNYLIAPETDSDSELKKFISKSSKIHDVKTPKRWWLKKHGNEILVGVIVGLIILLVSLILKKYGYEIS